MYCNLETLLIVWLPTMFQPGQMKTAITGVIQKQSQVWIKTLNYNTMPSSYHGQITLSNIEEICPLAIPNQISFISMHVPGLVKIHWCLLKLSSGNENMGVSRATNPVKIWRNLPISIPNQISTLSKHIPNLVKIHWCLLKISLGNKIQTDVQLEDGRLDEWTDTWTSNMKP